jgi:hypothetical protein
MRALAGRPILPKISGTIFASGNRIAGGCRAAYTYQQMIIAPKPVYLFLSSENDFAAFCCI